ncbi:hypothetical protein A3J21_01695 [Candidatus Daviesbacteria bacterium RIFCSPLOWO2_02_FULL_43_11]|nr:MAG: hypothetical protein A3J21_01695 [Candidatus Daviesbacteria bacterium RIFCSPLOWO2_02_FULL_43_11]
MMVSGMKKVAALISSLGFLVTAATAFAVSPTPISIRVVAPLQGVNPSTTIGTLLSNILTIVFVLAAIVVLFMLIIGAFQWITSGGDKEGVESARKRITHALIGFAILALAFLIVQVVGQMVNINIVSLESLPTLGQCGPGQTFDPAASKCIDVAKPTP